MTPKSLERKLQNILQNPSRRDFIIADAKDADMAYGLTAPGRGADGSWKTLEQYRDQIRAVLAQGKVDILLMSASNIEQLAIREKLFENSPVTPAARANDTTDIWVVRGGVYCGQPSRPFRSASIAHIMHGQWTEPQKKPFTGADLGLYSMTLNNDLERDYASLQAYRDFRNEAERYGFRYFLEVFNPNMPTGFSPEQTGAFLNDHITRLLAGVTDAQRPVFLKIPYNGPKVMEELAAYDPRLVVGILGGGAGTTMDAFKLIHDAQKYGARVALFGRKINFSEDPLSFISYLRAITDGELSPEEAVRAYHGDLQKKKIPPQRPLEKDLETTEQALCYK